METEKLEKEKETLREGFENEIIEGRNAVIEALRAGRANPKLLDRIPDESAKSLAAAKALTITRQWMATHAKKHEKPSGEGGKNLPLRLGDFELVPALWRQPDAVTVSGDGRLELMLDTLDEGTLFLGVDLYKGQALTFQKRRREP